MVTKNNDRRSQNIPSYQEQFMHKALQLALENVTAGRGGPFGAVIVRDGKVLGEGVNLVTSTNDPTAHAEIMAIRQACQKTADFKLPNAVLYSSCEPCPMCLSALYWAGISKVYYANTRKDAAAIGFNDNLIYKEVSLPVTERALPMVHTPSPEAMKAFSEWQHSNNKVPY